MRCSTTCHGERHAAEWVGEDEPYLGEAWPHPMETDGEQQEWRRADSSGAAGRVGTAARGGGDLGIADWAGREDDGMHGEGSRVGAPTNVRHLPSGRG